jgi:hypothetical protein
VAKVEPHAGFKGSKWHKTDKTGCIFKHPTTKDHVCDYAKNGFDNLDAGRYGNTYNNGFQDRAKRLGYIEGGAVNTSKTQGHVDGKAGQYSGDKAKSQAWKDKWKERLDNPLALLAKEEKAWDKGYKYPHIVKPWWRGGGGVKKPPEVNYKPKRYGGWHYYYPLKHNWHHLIPKGELSNAVINGKPPAGGEDKCTPLRRAQVIISEDMIGWNINNKDNIILLPCEEPHALIMALPSHCPWSLPNHSQYINLIKSELDDVRGKIDKAIMDATPDKDHIKEVTIAKDTLDQAVNNVFDMFENLSRLIYAYDISVDL